MLNRPFISQSVHDRVIQTAYNNLDKVRHDVYINPGQQKQTSVGGQYPDIIITEKNNLDVKWIIEVETSDSITQYEAVNQWMQYSKLGGIFYLLVPRNSKSVAEQICFQNNIKARFGTYTIDNSNIIQIIYE